VCRLVVHRDRDHRASLAGDALIAEDDVMAVMIDNKYLPDLIRSVRAMIVTEQKTADAHKGESTWATLQNGVRHLEALLRHLEDAYEKAKH
jgi:hypothetical protein